MVASEVQATGIKGCCDGVGQSAYLFNNDEHTRFMSGTQRLETQKGMSQKKKKGVLSGRLVQYSR